MITAAAGGAAVGGTAAGGTAAAAAAGVRGFVLTTWRMNLDGGRAMDGEPHLAGTARPDVVRLSAADAAALGVRDDDLVSVRGPASSITLPVAITPMVDGVVWLPARIDGIATAGRLGADVTDRVEVVAAGATGAAAGRGR